MILLKALAGVVVMFVAIFASIPFLILSMGYGIIGEEEREIWWFGHAPVCLFMDWAESRRG